MKITSFIWKHKFKVLSLIAILSILPYISVLMSITPDEYKTGIPKDSCKIEPDSRYCQIVTGNNILDIWQTVFIILIIMRGAFMFFAWFDKKTKKNDEQKTIKEAETNNKQESVAEGS